MYLVTHVSIVITNIIIKENKSKSNTITEITIEQYIESFTHSTFPKQKEEPIEVFFNQIEEAVEYAQNGRAPYTNAQVLNTAFVVMAQAKIFKDACKEWRKKPNNEKSWSNFKNHFFVAYAE